MQIGMIGLGRMGANMARRLATTGHQCVVFDPQPEAVAAVLQTGIQGASSLQDLADQLARPRVIWLMIPAAAVERNLELLMPILSAGDILIDGGNSFYQDDIRRGIAFKVRDIHYVDVGTSGGIAGLERGYCLMIGGEKTVVDYLTPIFSALAPGVDAAPPIAGRARSESRPQSSPQSSPRSTAEQGYLHCGAQGAGHFVKMIHNGIEYGIMGAYAEGLNILQHANSGRADNPGNQAHSADTTPQRHPEFYQYEFDLPEITELWRRGSVIGSWLLDLTASALANDPQLAQYAGQVSDSGEGRWTILAALNEAVPVPILSAALYARFTSRGEADFANKVLSAMRQGFGGHREPGVPPGKENT